MTYEHSNEISMGPAVMGTYKLTGKADIAQIIPSFINTIAGCHWGVC